MLVMARPAHVKAAVDAADAGQFEAIVSVFGNVDSYGDRVLPGAFAETLAEWKASGNPIPVLWSHRMEDPDFHIGYVVDAEERPEGLWVSAQLDLDAPKAAQVWRLLKGRRVTQFSFAYDVLDAAMETVDGEEAYNLKRLKLYEVGPCLIGANQETDLLATKQAVERLVVKAGRVLSSTNEKKLQQASDLLGEVLATVASDDSGKATADTGVKDEVPEGDKSSASTRSPASDLSALDALELAVSVSA